MLHKAPRAAAGKFRLKLPRTAQARRLLGKREMLAACLREEWCAHKNEPALIEVYFVEEPDIQKLHRDYLQDPASTDIITFDLGLSPEDVRLGTLYICPEVAARFAIKFRVSVSQEIHRLITHGVLHLLGYDDHTRNDKRRMRRAENRILARLGFIGKPTRRGRRNPA